MGSMEARRRLSLPHQGKWCGGKRDDCTPATDDNLQDRGRTPRAGDAEDEGVTAAAGDLPRAGYIGHAVPSAFLHDTRAWMSQPQCAERRVLPAR